MHQTVSAPPAADTAPPSRPARRDLGWTHHPAAVVAALIALFILAWLVSQAINLFIY